MALVASCAVGGCSHLSDTVEQTSSRTVTTVVEESRKSAPMDASWDSAMKAFQEGDFSRAGEIFASLAEASTHGEGKRRALYGLACSRLMLAKDGDSLKAAMAIWEQWQEQVAGEVGGEDPRMLDPVLRRLVSLTPMGGSGSKIPGPPAGGHRKPLQGKEEELRQKEEELRAREEEIQRLREQIEALEAIHHAIEQKKKGTTIP